MIREIVLDTETTGTDARNGDRLVEIGCVELVNQCPTGRSFHTYLNPEVAVSEGAFAVHGLSNAFLADRPLFAAVVDDFLAFLGEGKIVIHNAAFDVGFIDMELGRLGRPGLPSSRVVDTLAMARRKHPGAGNSLDALCQRYRIDNSRRTKHGALLDAEILAEVYIELLGGKQAGLALMVGGGGRDGDGRPMARPVRARPPAPRLTAEEIARHQAFVATLGEKAIWNAYAAAVEQAVPRRDAATA